MPAGEAQRGVDLVVDVAREDAVADDAVDAGRRGDDEVDEVDRVAGIVVQRAAAFVLGRAPGRALPAQHDRAVCLGTDMVDVAERARLHHPRGFLERADEAIVVADLSDERLGARHFDQTFAFGDVEHERLLAEHVQTAFESLAHHRRVQLRRRGDDQGVELLGVEHAIEVAVALEAGVLAQDVGEVGGGIASGDQVKLRMGPNEREMRQAHLAEAHHAGPDHASFRRKEGGR